MKQCLVMLMSFGTVSVITTGVNSHYVLFYLHLKILTCKVKSLHLAWSYESAYSKIRTFAISVEFHRRVQGLMRVDTNCIHLGTSYKCKAMSRVARASNTTVPANGFIWNGCFKSPFILVLHSD